MRYGLDPSFRLYGEPLHLQRDAPLPGEPVQPSLRSTTTSCKRVRHPLLRRYGSRIEMAAIADPAEPSATPTQDIVYTRLNGGDSITGCDGEQ